MAESIFPFISQSLPESTVTRELPAPAGYAWDFDNDCMRLIDGKVKVVTEAEAIRIWAMKALRTPRYRYLAYSWDYGNELESLIGQGLSKEIVESETVSLLRQALLVNPHIQDIKNVSLNLEGSRLEVNCTLLTLYGEVTI